MKRIVLFISMVILFKCIHGLSFGSEMKNPGAQKLSYKASEINKKKLKFVGYRVVSIDKGLNKIILSVSNDQEIVFDPKTPNDEGLGNINTGVNNNRREEIIFNSKTKFSKMPKEVGRISDIYINDKVTIKYEKDKIGRNIAKEIIIWPQNLNKIKYVENWNIIAIDKNIITLENKEGDKINLICDDETITVRAFIIKLSDIVIGDEIFILNNSRENNVIKRIIKAPEGTNRVMSINRSSGKVILENRYKQIEGEMIIDKNAVLENDEIKRFSDLYVGQKVSFFYVHDSDKRNIAILIRMLD